MSSIPVNERSWSPLETQHLCRKLRSKVTNELLLSFGYSRKKLDAHVKKVTQYIKDPEERKTAQEKIRQQLIDFHNWLIQDERKVIADLIRDIDLHLRGANGIWPTYYSEFIERRLELDRARSACQKLQTELNYIADQLPADKNRYMQIVLDVNEIYNKIGKLRSSDNRFLDQLPDVPPAVKARRQTGKKKK